MSVMTGPTPKRTGSPSSRIGVGIDTSRYGHYAAFLRDDLQPAAAELSFAAAVPRPRDPEHARPANPTPLVKASQSEDFGRGSPRLHQLISHLYCPLFSLSGATAAGRS